MLHYIILQNPYPIRSDPIIVTSIHIIDKLLQ